MAVELDIENSGDAIFVRASCLKMHVRKVIGLLKEILAEPAFGKTAFERERDMLIRDIESDLASPRVLAEDLARCAIFGPENPVGFTPEMEIASLKKMTVRTVKDFYRRIFDPARTVVSAGGALTEKEAEACLNDVCSAIPWTDDPMPMPSMPEFRRKKVIRLAKE